MKMEKTNKNVEEISKFSIIVFMLTLGMITWSIVDRVSHTAHAEPNETTTTMIFTTTETTTTTSVETTTTTSTTLSTTTTGVTTTHPETTTTTTEISNETETTVLSSQEEQVTEFHEDNPGVVISNREYIIVDETEPQQTTVVSTTQVETTTSTTMKDTTESTTVVVETEEDVIVVEETESDNNNETYLGNFRITGYVATGGKTASGTWPSSSRTIAMNKTQFKNLGLKWGDQIRIEGIGTFTLEDCGCKSGVIDVFRDSVSACYELPSYADAYLINNE